MNRILKTARLRAGAAMALAGVALMQASLHAQEQGPKNEQDTVEAGETIIVTGSRIVRPELDVANPIVAVTAE